MMLGAGSVYRKGRRIFGGTIKRFITNDPATILPGHRPRVGTVEESMHLLQSNSIVYIQGAAATPDILVQGMVDAAKKRDLKNINTVHLHLEGLGPLPEGDDEIAAHIHPVCAFTGANLRKRVAKGEAEYVPIFLSEIPLIFRRKVLEPNLALVQVSPPDKHGYCSLGTSVDVTRAALEHSSKTIGLVNKHMPRTLGDGIVHVTQLDFLVENDAPIHIHESKPASPEEDAIGKLIANHLVQNEATLQMGIGSIPDATLLQLQNHKNLGVHTEMFSTGVLPLVESGVINNSCKTHHRGRMVSSFCVGNEDLYDFIDDNQSVSLLDVEYVNSPATVAAQHKMTAINSCVEIDITGQIVSDSIGERIYSGVGGQVDFIRGAAICEDGRSIIALPSRTKRGLPRIVPTIKNGGGVVTTRAHVHYVVTENGIANLFGRPLAARARQLIGLAHPDDREALEKYAFERFGVEALERYNTAGDLVVQQTHYSGERRT